MKRPAPLRSPPQEDSRQRLGLSVERLAHLLPAQGPIGVFIHHNTLHAFEHLPFEEAVCAGAKVYGTEPFLREEEYRNHLSAKRILVEDIEFLLDRECNEAILPNRLDRCLLRRKLLIAGPRRFEPSTIQWHLEETNLLQSLRTDADPAMAARLRSGGPAGESKALRELFETCLGMAAASDEPPQPNLRLSETILRQTGFDLDQVVHPLLIRLCGAFLDQGIAYWPMPNRKLGFLGCVRALLSQQWDIFPEHLSDLGTEWRRQSQEGMDAAAVVISMLDRFGVKESDWDRILQAELLALPGWAGMFHRLEEAPELALHKTVPCSLMDFLAVRLTLEAVAATSVMGRKSLSNLDSCQLTPALPPVLINERRVRAARLFDAFQLLGMSAGDLSSIGPILRQRLTDEIQAFGDLEQRRILHLAYELRHELGVLRPLASYRETHPPVQGLKRPAAQVFFCMDEREESMRRHLEEIAPDVETFGAAGFFGVAMDYAGIDDAHGVALCPIVVKPRHAVRERPVEEHKHLSELRRRRRKLLASVTHTTFVSSRSLIRGWASTAGFGLFSLLPLAARVLAPRSYGRGPKALKKFLLPRPRTELNFIRPNDLSLAADEKLLQGFSTVEKVDRVAGVLRPAGLHSGFSRIVVILGHGSTSLNNPHESAHDCGACGGGRGGPNGRIFAAMANRPEVREGVLARGIHIPKDTWFIGGDHDTCTDNIDLYDLEAVPDSHREDLDRIRMALHRVTGLDAMERSRRFEAARSDISPNQALRHVQARAQHLAEPRPEYGHATNAVCIVGRRQITSGLFLDRRAFLVSYNSALDPTDEGLAQLLGAAIPVCAGISLEYYFSFVDNEGYGCGTKLPHNITGLIGVMNGHASDLRTGLPLQMVEVHEPVRMLFVVETTPERVMKVISANPGLWRLVNNRWVRLATIDPDTGEIYVRRDHGFEKLDRGEYKLPSAETSADWFRGKLEHLPIAEITGHARE